MAEQNEDPTWTLLIIVALLGGVCWVIWHFFWPQILEGMRYLRLLEMSVMGVVDPTARACSRWLWEGKVGLNVVPTNAAYQEAIGCFGADNLRALPSSTLLSFYNITPSSMSVMTDIVGSYWRIPAIAAAFFVSLRAIMTRRNSFKTLHTLESFIKVQSRMWPVIAPFVSFKPANHSARVPGDMIPDKLPPFAEALSPEEWISFNRISVTNNIPEREAVRRTLLAQLGPRWHGAEGLPPHILALFAAFALQGAQKRDESSAFLGRVALCWSHEHGFKISSKLLAEAEKIAADPGVGGKALEIAKHHAYRTTALLGILKWARFMGGVLAPAQFLWLRAVDRELWYPLNNMGRRSFHMEGAGAIAHFMAEETAGKALAMPRLDTAIITLNKYVAEGNLTIPPREEARKSGDAKTRLLSSHG